MKILFSLFCFLIFHFYSPAQNIQKIKTSDVLKLIDTSNSPLIINFWATWCRPCVAEIPVLEKNVALYKNSGVRLVLINLNSVDDYKTNLQAFAQQHGYQSQIFWLDENNLHNLFSSIDKKWFGTIPATLMINNANNYQEFYRYGLADYQIQAYLKDLIGR